MSIAHDQLIIGSELNGALMTPEEFDSAQDWDELYAYELINGVLIVRPPPDIGERGPNDLLGYLLRAYHEQHLKGSALDYTATEQTIRTKHNRRRADRVIWAGLGRIPDDGRDLPAIAIEFVSAGRRNRERDYQAKRQEYDEIGIAEYWIIDRFRRTMKVLRQTPDGPIELTLKEGETYATALLPGFEVPLARLFAESDMLEQARNEDVDEKD